MFIDYWIIFLKKIIINIWYIFIIYIYYIYFNYFLIGIKIPNEIFWLFW